MIANGHAGKVSVALMTRDITPNSSYGISTLFAMNGRHILVERPIESEIVDKGGDRYDLEDRRIRSRNRAVKQAQSTILEFDPQHTGDVHARGRSSRRAISFARRRLGGYTGRPKEEMESLA